MPERCFYGFLTIFLFAVPLSRKRKAAHDRPLHKWNKPSYTAGKPGRMILSVRPDTLGQTYKIILPCRWFARFHASGSVPFLLALSLFTDFSFEVFLSNLPPPPFTPPLSAFLRSPTRAFFSFWEQNVIPGVERDGLPPLLASAAPPVVL